MPNKFVKVSISIPKELKDRVAREAERQNRSFSNMVTYLLDQKLQAPVVIKRRASA